MATETELQKRAEEMFGKELAKDLADRHKWIFPIASYDFTTANAFVTSTNIFLPGKSCAPANLFDIGGVAGTGSDGKRVLRLRDFSCIAAMDFVHPANVVATPRSSQPFFLDASTCSSVPEPDRSQFIERCRNHCIFLEC